jgi:serpin B
MAYAGADGATREEMAHVLHLRGDGAQVADDFSGLQKSMDELVQRSVRTADSMKEYGRTNEPITLEVANRLFGQEGYDFRPAFLDLLKMKYDAPFEALDFRENWMAATKTINDWVEQQTKQHIRNLVPDGALNRRTRLVLVNALYLKAPWAEPFSASATTPMPFHPGGGAPLDVPTMSVQKNFGYAKSDGLTIVSIPYIGGELQFLIILPDDVNGLAKAEAALTAGQLEKWASLPNREVKLYLPKFKIQPPTLPLGDALQKLGMTSAFDMPRGSANFDLMAPRRPNDYLYISDVFHKTYLSVDEKGTEAAAATAVVMMKALAIQRPIEPVEVRVDHPFILAVQQRASGACLFLGHVADPRATNM